MSMVDLHEDFADLRVDPGHMTIESDNSGAFRMVNLLALGGEPDRHPHVPENVGAMRGVDLWESTGSSISLPFWNTNFTDDVYLYLVHGRVRVEFKEVESDRHLGAYEGRTGDLMCLPRAVAHRTYSGDGRRRISLELVPHNPLWDRIGEHVDIEPATELRVDDLEFDVAGDTVAIATPHGVTTTPADALLRGLRALVAYELHLDHNEFDGGFVVHDRDDAIRLATVDGYDELYDPRQVLAVFKALVAALEAA